MLAGIEKTVQPREPIEVNAETAAIDATLAELIDYAGLYPPARLDMGSAVRNFRRYRRGAHRRVLGRFIVDLGRITQFHAAAGSDPDMRLSVILAQPALGEALPKLLDQGLRIESVECKASCPREVEQLTRILPTYIAAFVEIPLISIDAGLLHAISDAGACVKMRMGGVVAESFPSSGAVARMLGAISEAKLSFKATAGLHHPLRSRHPFTNAHDSPAGWMHGFINLLCATALIHCGADIAEVEQVLEEQNPEAWKLSPHALAWRAYSWPADDLSRVREKFISFGSCSFEEPIHDLEALAWL